MTKKTKGQVAYEADVMARPLYADGAPRKAWEGLSEAAQRSWEMHPVMRVWRVGLETLDAAGKAGDERLR